jgi:predicted PurR-regulated permease PerM
MPGWRIVLWSAVVLAAIGFLYLVRGVLFPFAVALTIAAVLEPTIQKLGKRGMKRGPAVALVLLGFFGAITLAGYLAAPTVVRQVSSVSVRAQEFTRSIVQESESDNFYLRWSPSVAAQRQTSPSGEIDRILAQYGSTLEQFGLPSTRRGLIEQYVDKNRTTIAKAVQGIFDSFFGALAGLFSQLAVVGLIPLIVMFFLMEMEAIRKRGSSWIPPSILPGARSLANDVAGVFFNYLRGISLLILYFGIVQTTLLTLMGLPYSVLFGILFASFYLIPIVGNLFSSLCIWLIIGFSGVSGNAVFSVGNPWAYGFVVILIYMTIATLFDSFVSPRTVGNSVGLSPVVSIFVVMCGQALFGLPGMVLAFPVAGAIKVILDRVFTVTSSTSEAAHLPAVPLRHRRTAGPS